MLTFTAFNAYRFRVCDKLFRTRNYRHTLEYLEKADADCQRRDRASRATWP